MEEVKIRTMVNDFIPSITNAEGVSKLFSILGYPHENIHLKPLQRHVSSFDFNKDDADKIKSMYSPLTFGEDIPVFLLETSSLHPTFIRSVTSTLDRQYLRFIAIFSKDYSEIVFVYPKRIKDEKGKNKLKITKLWLDKDNLSYTQIQTLASICYPKDANWREVWRLWGEAFSVESVTKKFFDDYRKVFFDDLRGSIIKKGFPTKEAHEFSLQFLNRIMFIYFISKKGWLKKAKFVKWLWDSYKSENCLGTDTFYDKWLSQVFFKAFNNQQDEINGLPDDVTKILAKTPYLNGGLFAEKEIDKLDIKVTDDVFKQVLGFFERYNFTIREDMPLDEEVAVDPQMIGYVYESLANVAEEIYDRKDLGIFYTPRIEVDLMCRRSLAGSLINQMPDVSKEALYHFVFDSPDDKDKINYINKYPEIWSRIEKVLDDLSIVDPACGSGAFLVGMLSVLTELYQIVYSHLNTKRSPFDIKYGIIQRSLYGVDVMPWAVRAAELRLWLQLVVDTEISAEDLRKGPLLPNLNLKLRVGDSMVQEIGGISFNIRTKGIDESIHRDLENLKNEKNKFFEGARTAKYRVVKEFCRVETKIFLDIIASSVKRIEKEIKKAELHLDSPTKQTDLFGQTITKEHQTQLKEGKTKKEIEDEINRLKDEIQHLKSVKSVLDDPEKKPFIWDIDFAEIFGEKNGFDIVIGNPPYVRQEVISPPNRLKSEVTLAERQEYKEKLIKSVKAQFPMIQKIDKKSDLYIYFYFHGLSLLNEKGIFCFITSNSWLDVGYGRDLQEFLLEYVPIHAIYDNPKRSFEHADVNTIIALFGAPALREESFEEKIRTGMNAPWTKLSNTAKFVMFKKPFEEAISAETMIDIENAEAKVKGVELAELVENIDQNDIYKIFPLVQEDLLEDGWEYPESYNSNKSRFKKGAYDGNKWGGKYLRAPDIFYTILKKGKEKLIRISDVSKVSFGIKTGANEFFYIDEAAQNKWNIEDEYLRPVIKSPRESKSPSIDLKNLKYKIFMCHKSKNELIGTKALEYIEYGEEQGIDTRKSISARKKWYDLGDWSEPKIIIPCGIGDTYRVFLTNCNLFPDKRLYFSNPEDENSFALVMNSTLYMFMQELNSRVGLGDGLLDLTVKEVGSCLILDPKYLSTDGYLLKILNRNINSVFIECGIDPTKPIEEQEPLPLPDRMALDKQIFDQIGLDDKDIKEIYLSLCILVKNRLDKAQSLS